MTIETSLGLTFFLVLMVSLCQLFLVMQIQLRIQRALEQVGNEAAQYSYLWDQVPLWESESRLVEQIQEYLLAEISEEALTLRLVDVLGEDILDHSLVTGGADGLSLEGSQLFQEHHRLHLVVSYGIRLPVAIWGSGEVTLHQQCYRYGLLGDRSPSQQPEPEESLVYVTKYGQVYHVSLSCTHLNLSVRSVSMTQVGTLRNEAGACYDACELCRPSGSESAVYLTKEGDRYHKTKECGGIRRYISTIPLSQIEQRRLCSRCGKET